MNIRCLSLALLLACAAHTAVAESYSVKGQVLERDGSPVAGGDVYLLHGFDVHTTTLKDGAFSFSALPPGPIHLNVLPVDFAIAGYSGFLGEDLEITLRCEPADVITLRITGNDFRPLGGVRPTNVVVSDRFLIPVEAFADAGFPLFRSDDEGILRLPFLPQGGFAKTVLRHYDFADLALAYLPVTTATQQVILYPGVEVEGRVTLGTKGAAKARIAIYPEAANDYREAIHVLSDPDGFFRVRLRNGDYYFAAEHPDGATAAPTLTQVIEIVERGGDTPNIALELEPLRSLHGRILYPDGKPCHGAHIVFRVDGLVTADTYTTHKGEFQLEVASTTGVLNVSPPAGFMMREMADIPVDFQEAREAKLEPITLEAIPAIKGRVLDDQGEPVARAFVSSLNLEQPLWALSDEEGRFHIRVFQEPEEGAIAWRIEHPDRFLRSDTAVSLEDTDDRDVTLKRFEPDQEQRPPTPRGNNLNSLINEDAPPIACSRWFNRENSALPENAIDEDGALDLSTLSGKVVVLYFWGGFDTTPDGLNALSEMLAINACLAEAEDVVVLGIHDATSLPEEVVIYLEDYRVPFPVGLDDGLSETFASYKVGHIPQTVLIDKEGKVRYYQTQGRLLELIKVLRRRG